MSDEYFDLGPHHRPITTVSAEAQRWFDRGLTWIYGFNHDEAILCFEKALEADAGCVMAYWGIAYAIGPNYNKIWDMFLPQERVVTLETAHQAISDGLALDAGTDVERQMLSALQSRYPVSQIGRAHV